MRELKRANEILLAASSFFARELDPRLPWSYDGMAGWSDGIPSLDVPAGDGDATTEQAGTPLAVTALDHLSTPVMVAFIDSVREQGHGPGVVPA